MKIYKIYGTYEYQFDGNDEIFVRVKNETSKEIIGFVTNLKGNASRRDYIENKYIEPKIVIIKSNISGWVELI